MFVKNGGRGGRGGHGNNTDQAAVPGRNEILQKEIVCYSCQRNRHDSGQYSNQTGTNLAQVVVILTKSCAFINHTWVLLQTCSTNSVSNNTDLVKEIRTCKNQEKLTVSTNGGLMSFDKKEKLNFFQ